MREDLKDYELTDWKLEDMFDEYLDEVYPDCNIAGYDYSTSNALKEVDLTAYRTGFNDWLDSVVTEGAIYEHNGKYYSENPDDFKDDE